MSESTAWAIDLEDVGFAWPGGERLLSIPSLKIGHGERVFLKGPSGSGKSTLLGLIGGVLKPTHGTVSVLGQSLKDLSGARRDAFRAAHIGFIFQMFNLLPFLSMIDNAAKLGFMSRSYSGCAFYAPLIRSAGDASGTGGVASVRHTRKSFWISHLGFRNGRCLAA